MKLPPLSAIFLLFALFLQALIPVGFMPSAVAGVEIVICTAYGEQTIFLENGEQAPAHKSEKPCVFDFGATADIAYTPILAAPPSYALVYEQENAAAEFLSTPPSFQARAPPILS